MEKIKKIVKEAFESKSGILISVILLFPIGVYFLYKDKSEYYKNQKLKYVGFGLLGQLVIFSVGLVLIDTNQKQTTLYNLAATGRYEDATDYYLKYFTKSKGDDTPTEMDPIFMRDFGSEISDIFIKRSYAYLIEFEKEKDNERLLSLAMQEYLSAETFDNKNDKLPILYDRIKIHSVFGSYEKANSICIDKIETMVKHPDSLEFEHSKLKIFAAQATLGKFKPDLNTPTYTIYKVRSWFKSKNDFGMPIKNNFNCSVKFDKNGKDPEISEFKIYQ